MEEEPKEDEGLLVRGKEWRKRGAEKVDKLSMSLEDLIEPAAQLW